MSLLLLVGQSAPTTSRLSYAAEVMADKPTSYWHLTGNVSTQFDWTTVTPTGNAKNLSFGVSGQVSGTTVEQAGIHPNGSTSASTVDSTSYNGTTWTVEFWFGGGSTSTAGQTYGLVGRASNSNWSVCLDRFTEQLIVKIRNSTGATTVSVTSNAAGLITGGAIHYTCVQSWFDGTDCHYEIWIDGSLDKSGVAFTGTPGNTANVFTACQSENAQFSGTIGHIAVWAGRNLPVERIQRHHAVGRGTAGITSGPGGFSAQNLTGLADSVDRNSYVTSSITPSANTLILALVENSVTSGTAAIPTLTGNGLTWVQVDTALVPTSIRTTVFRAMGASPTSGAVTADMGGVTQSGCCIIVDQILGADTGGTNGSAAVVNSGNFVDSSGLTIQTGGVTMPLAYSNSAVYAGATSAINVAARDAEWSIIGTVTHSTPNRNTDSSWGPVRDPTPTIHVPNTSGVVWATVVLEIKSAQVAQAAPIPVPTVRRVMQRR